MSRVNMVLLAAVLVMGAIVVLVEKPWSGAKPEGYVARKALFEDFDPSRVVKVELSRAEQKLVLARHDDRWVIESEGDYPADKGQVDQILAAVQQWKIDARVGTAQKSETYMVDESKGTRVTLRDASGATLADLFTGRVGGFDAKEAQRQGGKVDTESFGIYVRRADARDVFFMKGLFLGTFSPDTSSFIDRALVSYDAARTVRFVATCGAAVLSIVKDAGAWKVEGMELPPDDAAIKLMVEAFGRLSAVSLEGKYEPGKFGLEPPACVVEATLEDGTTHVVEVGTEKEGKGYYARKPGDAFVVLISKWEVESYRKTPRELGRKRLWDIEQPDLVSIQVTRPGDTLRIEKQGEEWNLITREVGAIPADRTASWKMINALSNAEVKEYVGKDQGPADGTASPRLTAVGTTKDGKTLTLLVGKDRGEDQVFARNGDSPWVVALPRSVLTDLSITATDLKQKPPAPPPS